MDTKMLSVIVFISIFMFLGLSLVYLYLYNQYREKYMFIWGIGWLLASLRIVLDLVRFNVFDSTLLLVVNQLFTISAAMFLVWGMYAFMGKRLPRFWVISGIAVTLFADVVFILGLSFDLAAVPTACYLLVAHLWLGGKFLSFWGSKGSGKYITGYANIFLGALILTYPLMVNENNPERAILYFCFGIIISIAILMGILLVYYEKIRFELSTSEQRFRMLVENAKDVVYRFNLKDRKFDYLSPSVFSITGYSPEDLYRSPELLREVIGQEFEEFLRDVRSGHKGQVNPFKVQTKQGDELWVEQTFVPIQDSLGQVVAVEGIVRDITERRKLEREMIRLDSLRLTGETAAGIAHEIRNPLTSVRGFLQLIMEKPAIIESKDVLSLMICELDRANDIITNFLAFSREQEPNLKLNNLNQLIMDIVPLIESNAVFAGKNIKTSLSTLPPFQFDENKIKQMIVNLVQNGLEAMDAGGNLEIQTFYNEGKVILMVKDQGPGIKLDILDKLGTPFFTTKEKGTGLGLAVCYGIAANHEATISVETGNNGTTFTVMFKVTL